MYAYAIWRIKSLSCIELHGLCKNIKLCMDCKNIKLCMDCKNEYKALSSKNIVKFHMFVLETKKIKFLIPGC